MPRVKKNPNTEFPIQTKLHWLLTVQNHEAKALMKTNMPKPDTMPSLALAKKYNEVLNMYVRNHMQRRLKVIVDLRATILERQVKMLNECAELLRNKKVAQWFVLHNKYKAMYGLD